MPEQRQPLAQRIGPRDHAVDPPRLEPADILGTRLHQFVSDRGEIRRHALAAGRAREQSVDRCVWPAAEVSLKLPPGRCKSSPSVQMNHPHQVPGVIWARDVPIPAGGAAGFPQWIAVRIEMESHRGSSAPALGK